MFPSRGLEELDVNAEVRRRRGVETVLIDAGLRQTLTCQLFATSCAESAQQYSLDAGGQASFQSREIERGSRGSAVDLAWESRVFGVGSHPKHRHGRV